MFLLFKNKYVTVAFVANFVSFLAHLSTDYLLVLVTGLRWCHRGRWNQFAGLGNCQLWCKSSSDWLVFENMVIESNELWMQG